MLPGHAGMVRQAVFSSIGKTRARLYVVNGAEEYSPGWKLEQKGAEPLDNGAVSGNVGIPVARIPY